MSLSLKKHVLPFPLDLGPCAMSMCLPVCLCLRIMSDLNSISLFGADGIACDLKKLHYNNIAMTLTLSMWWQQAYNRDSAWQG